MEFPVKHSGGEQLNTPPSSTQPPSFPPSQAMTPVVPDVEPVELAEEPLLPEPTVAVEDPMEPEAVEAVDLEPELEELVLEEEVEVLPEPAVVVAPDPVEAVEAVLDVDEVEVEVDVEVDVEVEVLLEPLQAIASAATRRVPQSNRFIG
jgi:hypothetical protein